MHSHERDTESHTNIVILGINPPHYIQHKPDIYLRCPFACHVQISLYIYSIYQHVFSTLITIDTENYHFNQTNLITNFKFVYGSFRF